MQAFPWQVMPKGATACTDSDWAGGRETRKSTRGGLLMLGQHQIKSWSSYPEGHSTAERGSSTLRPAKRGETQANGLMSMLREWNTVTQAVVNTDATAAMGIASRSGLGKTRHLDIYGSRKKSVNN